MLGMRSRGAQSGKGFVPMRRSSRLVAVLIGGIALAAMSALPAAALDPVKIGFNIWVGYGPLYIARDKGFFQKHGVDVELIIIEEVREKLGDLAAGKLDMAASGGGTSLIYLTEPDQLQYVAATEDSNGADGIIAKKEITTLADLRGKRVALNRGGLPEFYLATLLKTAGLRESDVTLVDMPGDVVGKAFIDREVDAAVTWEPWLSRAKATDFGHLLIDTSVTPGVVFDVLVARKDFVLHHAKDVRAVVDAWNDAVAYFDSHRQEAIDLMAKDMGDWLKDPKTFAETLDGVRYYGASENKAFFGTKEKPGPLYEAVKEAIAVWSDLGKMKVKATPEDIVNFSFVND
jgi:NitT/TauT family transport system substrate-binding protein